MSDVSTDNGNNWFYEEQGRRIGPVTEIEIIGLMKKSIISYGSAVWTQGFPEWLKVENTNLRVHLSNTPPPLSGDKVSNGVVWILAFGPILGYMLEWFVASSVYSGNELAAAIAMATNKYWYVTLILNIGLSIIDEKRLKKAGYNTDKFKGWVWIVPVYLFQRAKATRQNLAYFIVWLVCFALVILA